MTMFEAGMGTKHRSVREGRGLADTVHDPAGHPGVWDGEPGRLWRLVRGDHGARAVADAIKRLSGH